MYIKNIVLQRNQVLLIQSCKWFQGFGCSPRKAVHDLSLERRETVWSLSTAGVEN